MYRHTDKHEIYVTPDCKKIIEIVYEKHYIYKSQYYETFFIIKSHNNKFQPKKKNYKSFEEIHKMIPAKGLA